MLLNIWKFWTCFRCETWQVVLTFICLLQFHIFCFHWILLCWYFYNYPAKATRATTEYGDQEMTKNKMTISAILAIFHSFFILWYCFWNSLFPRLHPNVWIDLGKINIKKQKTKVGKWAYSFMKWDNNYSSATLG